MNMVKGLDKLVKGGPDYEHIYYYNNKYMNKKQIVAATKDIWTDVKDPRTKYKRLEDYNQWDKVPANIGLDFVAKLWGVYSITTNGVVFAANLVLTQERAKVRLTKEDGERKEFYISDLLHMAFIDNNYDPESQNTWFLGEYDWKNEIYIESMNLSEFEYKDVDKKATKGSKTKSEPETIVETITYNYEIDRADLMKELRDLKEEVKVLKEKGKKIVEVEKIVKVDNSEEIDSLRDQLAAAIEEGIKMRSLAEDANKQLANLQQSLEGTEGPGTDNNSSKELNDSEQTITKAGSAPLLSQWRIEELIGMHDMATPMETLVARYNLTEEQIESVLRGGANGRV